MPALRSRTSTHGRNMAGARALWRATGITDSDFGKPIIAVANSFTQFVPGHVHLRDMGRLVSESIKEAGAVGREFNTIAVDDGIAMGHGGMLYSLPSRELIADAVEYMVNAHCADALVCISNCDKITPGMLLAALRLNIPTVFVSGGPMEAGKAIIRDGQATTSLDLVNAMTAAVDPDVSDEELGRIEASACPTCGSCSGMFTANSMNCLLEAIGLAQPGNGSTLATAAARRDLFVNAGRLIVDLCRRWYDEDDASVLPRALALRVAPPNTPPSAKKPPAPASSPTALNTIEHQPSNATNLQTGRQVRVKGHVADANGEPIVGATVTQRGTKNATVTDIDGNFTIEVPAQSELTVSYIGFADQTVKAAQDVTIVLKANEESLDEVVVVGYGVQKKVNLTGAVSAVKGDELQMRPITDASQGLQGMVPGLLVTNNKAGRPGATGTLSLRGQGNLSGTGHPYVLVDGIEMSLSDINPNDIESISVLSGPAAAALYGSAAAQGVVMITTKKGKEGKVSVTVSHSTQFANPFKMPEFQNEYVNKPGSVASWGDKKPSAYGNYDPKNFFNTGTNIQNNVALTAGNDKNQTYLSIGTTNAAGILPNNKYNRYNFTFRNTTNMLGDKLTLDFGLNYILENDRNLTAQGQWFNPLTSVYLFPRGESFDAIRTYEIFDPNRNIYVQNWNYGDALKMQNP